MFSSYIYFNKIGITKSENCEIKTLLTSLKLNITSISTIVHEDPYMSESCIIIYIYICIYNKFTGKPLEIFRLVVFTFVYWCPMEVLLYCWFCFYLVACFNVIFNINFLPLLNLHQIYCPIHLTIFFFQAKVLHFGAIFYTFKFLFFHWFLLSDVVVVDVDAIVCVTDLR